MSWLSHDIALLSPSSSSSCSTTVVSLLFRCLFVLPCSRPARQTRCIMHRRGERQFGYDEQEPCRVTLHGRMPRCRRYELLFIMVDVPGRTCHCCRHPTRRLSSMRNVSEMSVRWPGQDDVVHLNHPRQATVPSSAQHQNTTAQLPSFPWPKCVDARVVEHQAGRSLRKL
jgi:hypothetical protein